MLNSQTPDKLNEELREAVADLPFDGKGLIHSLAANMEPEYFDALLDWIAQHTKEAVAKAVLEKAIELRNIAEAHLHESSAAWAIAQEIGAEVSRLKAELAAPTASPQQPKPLEEK